MGDEDNRINNDNLNLIESLVRNGVSKTKKKAILKRIGELAIEAKGQVDTFEAKQAIATIIKATALPKSGKAIKKIRANIYDAIRFNVCASTVTY